MSFKTILITNYIFTNHRGPKIIQIIDEERLLIRSCQPTLIVLIVLFRVTWNNKNIKKLTNKLISVKTNWTI